MHDGLPPAFLVGCVFIAALGLCVALGAIALAAA